MSQVTGIIQKANTNAQGYSSILVNDQWYSTYKTDYTALEGFNVTFDAVQKGKYWNANNVKPSDGAPTPAPAPTPAAAQRQVVQSNAQDVRQASIVLQSSYKTAADLLSGLITSDKVALGAKGKAFDAATGLLDELAVHIYRNCIDPQRFFEGRASENDVPVEEVAEVPEMTAWNPANV